MPQNPVIPAIINPAPTNSGTAKNQGETTSPRSVPKNARLPAPICTWRCNSSGWARSASTGRPAFFHASSPPSSTQGAHPSPSQAASRAALPCVRAPLRQWKITVLPRHGSSAVSSRDKGKACDAGYFLARPLVGLAHVDEDCALLNQAAGFGRGNGANSHLGHSFGSWRRRGPAQYSRCSVARSSATRGSAMRYHSDWLSRR